MESISLHRISKEHDLDRSFVTRQVKAWGMDILSGEGGLDGMSFISLKDYEILKANNFRCEEILEIDESKEISFKDIGKRLYIDRRNISHFLSICGIESFYRCSASSRRKFRAISLEDYDLLCVYRLGTCKHRGI
jgi:hypothetical protein